MRVLIDNRARGARLRMSLTEIAPRSSAASADDPGPGRGLAALSSRSSRSWTRCRASSACAPRPSCATTTSPMTSPALGERIEQFFDELAGLVEAVGSLDANRLARIRALFGRLVTLIAGARPARAAEHLHRAARPVRGPARRRGAVHARAVGHDGLHGGDRRGHVRRLQAQGRRLPERLLARARPARGRDRRPRRAARAESGGRGAMSRALAVAPHPPLSEAEVLRAPGRAAAAPVGGAVGLVRRRATRSCARSTPTCTPRSTGSCAGSAGCANAASSASTAPRSTARWPRCSPTHRTRPRATPSSPPPSACTARATCRCPSSTPTSSRPASRGGTRRSRRSRASCAAPGRGEVAAGRAARRSPTRAEAQAMAIDEELRRRALVDELLDRLPVEPARLSALPALDEESFDLLLDALGMALATGAVGYSDDGTLQLTVLDMGSDLPAGGGARRRRRRAREPGPAGPGEPGGRMIDTELEDRLRDARRALLARPLMLAGDPAFGTVRAQRRAAALGVPARARLRAGRPRDPRAAAQALARACAPTVPPGSRARATRTPGSRSRAATTCSSRSPSRRASGRGRRRRIGLLAEEVRSLASEDGHRARPRPPRGPPLPGRRLPVPGTLGVLVAVAGQARAGCARAPRATTRCSTTSCTRCSTT